jgi:hypothetical protein
MASGGQRQQEVGGGGHDGHEDARTRAAHLVRNTMCPSLVAKLVGHPGPATAIEAEMSQPQDAPDGQDSSCGSAGRAAKLRLAKLQRGSLWAQGSLSTVVCRVLHSNSAR